MIISMLIQSEKGIIRTYLLLAVENFEIDTENPIINFRDTSIVNERISNSANQAKPSVDARGRSSNDKHESFNNQPHRVETDLSLSVDRL